MNVEWRKIYINFYNLTRASASKIEVEKELTKYLVTALLLFITNIKITKHSKEKIMPRKSLIKYSKMLTTKETSWWTKRTQKLIE